MKPITTGAPASGAIIISTGDELVSGLTINTNASWLATQLAQIGVPVRSHIAVGDSLTAVAAAIRRSVAESSLVLVTGGLGPTEDDVTRAALADALDQPLVEDPAALAAIEEFFQRLNRTMAPSNRLQALRPAAGSVLPNSCGTAPGIHIQQGRTDIYVMPGVPREMKAMFEQSVLPRLRAACPPEGRVTRMAKFNTFGVGESVIGQKVADLMRRGANPSVGTTVHDGLVSVRVYATGTSAQVDEIISEKGQQIHERLGPLIFSSGDVTLAAAVAAILTEQKQTLATAESCTGGLLAQMLTDIPGSSRYFLRGWIPYADAAKKEDLHISADMIDQHGAVSEPVAAAMAGNARRIAGADWGIGITGIAGPEGGSAQKPVGLVYIGLAGPSNVVVRRCQFPGDRQSVRLRSADMALTLLRFSLLGLRAETLLPQ